MAVFIKRRDYVYVEGGEGLLVTTGTKHDRSYCRRLQVLGVQMRMRAQPAGIPARVLEASFDKEFLILQLAKRLLQIPLLPHHRLE